jgi:hypothetical protein
MTTRELSSCHEEQVAKALGGRRTSNSGATPFTKGDVIVGDCLIECKTKMNEVNAFSIQKEWLETLEEERRGMGKELCAVAFSFNSGKDSYYVIDQKTMKKLLEMKHRLDDLEY